MENKEFKLEEVLDILHLIAKRYGKKTDEYRALEIVAHALLCMQHKEIRREFEQYMKRVGKDLPKQQKEHIRTMKKLSLL
ncbi:MAG: hypothetical protein LAP85_20945 [Acidobacteriia bacterium]|nr:hypothetical protein [Terriglobia bacterium]